MKQKCCCILADALYWMNGITVCMKAQNFEQHAAPEPLITEDADVFSGCDYKVRFLSDCSDVSLI